jgi:predicted amidohydrolase
MTTTLVAAVQMTSTPSVEQNLLSAEKWITQAVQMGAKMVVLPECFAYLGPDGGQVEIAESLTEEGPILRRCKAWATGLGVELVLGGFWERAATLGKVHNTCVHLGRDGTVRASYRKIHLFDVDLADGTRLEESQFVVEGEQVQVSDAPFGKLGLSICYDLRFPELYRKLVDQGAIALTVPAAFTLHTGKDHWHVLLRARAIESQAYVIAAAQTGLHFGKRVSYGHALVADPWGCVIAQCGEGEGVAFASIDPSVVERVRRQLPSLSHRRL